VSSPGWSWARTITEKPLARLNDGGVGISWNNTKRNSTVRTSPKALGRGELGISLMKDGDKKVK
jgi:hypothetical protein